MDIRDICANTVLLTDDDKANDSDGWIAFTLTAIGLVPLLGSAVKGVGKVVIKNSGESMEAAIAVLRKLGKGDPVKYLREINWQNLGKQAASEVKAVIKGFRDTLQDISTSWKYDLLLTDSAIDGMQAMVKQLDEVTPQIDQGVRNAANEIGNRVNKALDEFEPPASTGVVGKPKKTVANELEPPKGNDLKGATALKRVRNPALDAHYKNLAAYETAYKNKLDDAIKNGDSSHRIGAFKAKLTEVKGERAASAYMAQHFYKPPPPAKMELGFGPGPGFDQVWAKRDKNGNVLEYFIVEAKGPGAELTKGAKKGDQMTTKWIKNTIKSMRKSKKYPAQNTLGNDLFNANDLDIPLNKIVIEAVEKGGQVVEGKLQPLP
ncbi:hypothetical protein H5186_22290 [Pseudoalteromonas sp. SG41-2]|nr:hypothetical protein [Pseudoalteromonas sp. SG41-2]